MPVYHGESYIRKNLSHLLAYDLTDIELIIVVCEDGFDQSAEVCSEILSGLKKRTADCPAGTRAIRGQKRRVHISQG